MRWYHLLLLAPCLIVISLPLVHANYSLSTNQSSYHVGETIIVNFCTDGGKVGLTASGPYTINANLGDLPQGCYNFPLRQAEQRDVGYWTIVMTMDTSVPLYPHWVASGYATNPPSTSFTVVSSPVPEFPAPVLILGVALVTSLIVTKVGIRRKLTK